MTFTQLTYVVAVDMYRNFRKAAQHCCITQPTLSMQIQKLEEELEVTIFDRDRFPIEPTDIGKLVIEQARVVLQERDRIQDTINSQRNEIFGKISIGIIPTVAPYLLPLFLDRLLKNYPGLTVTLDELQTDEIIRKLEHHLLDIGIVAGPIAHPRLTESTLYYEPFVGYISRSHALFSRQHIQTSDLSLDGLWLLKEGHCFRDQILNLCNSEPNRNTDEMPHLDFQGENLETLQKLVEKNIGMTLLPYLATLHLKDTSARALLKPFAPPVPTRKISLIHGKAPLRKRVIHAIQNEILSAVPQELLHQENQVVVPQKYK